MCVKLEPKEISELTDALDPELRVHDDHEAAPALLKSEKGDETLSIVNDVIGEEISWTQRTMSAVVNYGVLGHEGEV